MKSSTFELGLTLSNQKKQKTKKKNAIDFILGARRFTGRIRPVTQSLIENLRYIRFPPNMDSEMTS